MFSCIKTGFFASTPSGLYLYGDAFGIVNERWADIHNLGYADNACPSHGTLLLRIVAASSEPPPRVHLLY